MLHEGWRMVGEGRLPEAERLCRQHLAMRPDDPEGLHLLGSIALRLGRLPDAAGLVDQALAKTPSNPDLMVTRGVVHMAAGQADEGIAKFRMALEARAGNGNARLQLGLALMQTGQPEEGIKHLREAARLMPKSVPAHSNLGAALAEHEGAEASLPPLRKAAALAPNDPFVRDNLGTALLKSGDAEAALAEFEAAAALAPRNPKPQFGIARALEKLERPRQAMAAYERAVALDARFAPAHNNLGLLFGRRDEPDQAVVHLRKAVALWPQEREFRFNLAGALVAAGLIDEAEEAFLALMRDFPDSIPVGTGYASLLQQVGRFDRAREVLDEVRARTSDVGEYFPTLVANGAAAVPDDEIEKTAAFIHAGTAPDDTLARLCFAMGSVMEARKAYDEAFEHFRRGNEIRNAEYAYDPAEQHERTDRLMRTFDEAFFAERRDDGVADDRPVFVVGMMRSGTTLVEQIIASHRHAEGAGELEYFFVLARELAEILESPEPFPDCAPLLSG